MWDPARNEAPPEPISYPSVPLSPTLIHLTHHNHHVNDPLAKHMDMDRRDSIQATSLALTDNSNHQESNIPHSIASPPNASSMADISNPPSPTLPLPPLPQSLSQSLRQRPPTNSFDNNNNMEDMLSSCIARLTIPESHRPKFLALLSSLPDPAFKIKKKSVRFKSISTASSTSSPETKTQRRKELGGSVLSMTPEKSLARKSTGTFRALYGNPSGTSVGIGGNSSSNSGGCRGSGLAVVDKDPEEKMAELMELKQMKIRQDDLFHIKDQIHQVAQSLEGKESILDEVRAERKSLCAELSRYMTMIKQIQKDVGLVSKAETELTKDRDELQQQLTQLKDHDFKILKEEVDDLRAKKGLQPLPTLEQEHAQIMGQYLEQRRGQWRQDGQFLNNSTPFASPPPSSSLPGRSSTSSSAAATTSSSRASTSSTGRSRQSTSTLASAPGPTSLPASSSSSRGRESSLRHGKSRQSSPGRFRGDSNNNHVQSPAKSKHGSSSSSSSSRRSNAKEKTSPMRSARQSHNRNRSQSPASRSREERSKKRSRY